MLSSHTKVDKEISDHASKIIRASFVDRLKCEVECGRIKLARNLIATFEWKYQYEQIDRGVLWRSRIISLCGLALVRCKKKILKLGRI